MGYTWVRSIWNAEHCGYKLAANRGSTFPAETTVVTV